MSQPPSMTTLTSKDIVSAFTSYDNIDNSLLYTVIVNNDNRYFITFFSWIGTTLSLNTSNCKNINNLIP